MKKNGFTPPVRLPTYDHLSTDQLLELAVGRLNRMDGLILALFTRLLDQEAELKRLRASVGIQCRADDGRA